MLGRGGVERREKRSKRSIKVMQKDRGEMGKSSYSLLSHNQLARVTRHPDSPIHPPRLSFLKPLNWREKKNFIQTKIKIIPHSARLPVFSAYSHAKHSAGLGGNCADRGNKITASVPQSTSDTANFTTLQPFEVKKLHRLLQLLVGWYNFFHSHLWFLSAGT